MNNAQYINECISNSKEFDFIQEVSKYYKVNFYELCNFALDEYNYLRRNDLDVRGAKMMSLQNLCDYAYNNKPKCDKNDDEDDS